MAKDLLNNIRVADLTHYRSGPTGTSLLGSMGADVVKVEAIQRQDGMRFINTMDPLSPSFYEMGMYFNACNTNKRGITLDLNSARGKELFFELVKKCDVVIENFSPRVMDNLGGGYEQLKKINPAIIMVSMSSFGHTGPWRDFVGFGYLFDQIGGAAALSGYEDGQPTHMIAASDQIAGFIAVYAILLALEERERTGLGQHIDMSEVETLAFLLGPNIIDYQISGEIQPRMGNHHAAFSPHNAYPCKGDDEWATISVESDAQWAALAQVMGKPEWANDERYATLLARKKNEPDLDRALAEWTREQDKREVMKLLQSIGIISGAVLQPKDLLDDPQLKARNMHKNLIRKFVGEFSCPEFPIHFSDGICEQRMPAPTLGQHNEEVLTSLLGVTPQELEKLREDKIIGSQVLNK